MFVELAAAQAASFPVQSHSRSRILQASDIAQRDVSVHLNLIRLLRASGKEDEAAAEAALGAKIYPNLFASDRDMSKRQDAAANQRDEIRRVVPAAAARTAIDLSVALCRKLLTAVRELPP
jgi:hypothetical protein